MTPVADELRFLFNADDTEHWQAVRFDLGGPGVAGDARDGGQTIANVSMTDGPAPLPDPTTSQVLWLRVTSDGTTVKVYAQIAATQPSSWSDSTHLVKTSTNFDLTASGGGGRFGFGGDAHQVRVDDFTLRTDRDNNGSYETTEVVEDFTIDASGYAEETLTHDANGNLTYDGAYAFAYDAWNRLVKVTKAYRDPASPGTVSLGSVVNETEYDGLGRRIVKAVKNSAYLDATYHYYYNGQQLVETRNGSGNVLKQHVWGGASGGYIDELVQTALNDDPADGTEDDCESLYYALQDAHFNVLGMADSSGTLTERYEYTPYGQRTVYFSPGSNDPDAMVPTAISRRWTVSSTAQPYGLNDIGHQGLMHDEDTGLVYNRARMLHPQLGRFIQNDPIKYEDGLNSFTSYATLRDGLDPDGLKWIRVRRCRIRGGRRRCTWVKKWVDDQKWGGYPDPSYGNCARFAFKRPLPIPESGWPSSHHQWTPGTPGPHGDIYTCAEMMRRTKQEGAKAPDSEGNCPCKTRKIAVYAREAGTDGPTDWGDFHYLRRDPNGCWSEKGGNLQPVYHNRRWQPPAVDESNRKFCGYLCIK